MQSGKSAFNFSLLSQFLWREKDDRLLTIYEISEETPINLLAKRNLLGSTRTIYPSLQII